jgi:hypothetical protein
MEKTSRGLKEWNAVIEALGQGKQTVLIRKYGTSNKDFLLYPTHSYALRDKYLEIFQKKHRDFVKDNTLPSLKNGKTEIKYAVTVEKIIDRSPVRLTSFQKFHIWNKKHVKAYLNSGRAKIWIMRTYKLNKPLFTDKKGGMLYVKFPKKIDIFDAEPVIADSEFENLLEKIEKIS